MPFAELAMVSMQQIKAFYMRENDDGKTVAAMDVLVPGVSFQTHALETRLTPISPDSLIQAEWRWGADKAEARVFLWGGCYCSHAFSDGLPNILLGRLWLSPQVTEVSGGGHSRLRLMDSQLSNWTNGVLNDFPLAVTSWPIVFQ